MCNWISLNLLGTGVDIASVSVGVSHGVYQLMKQYLQLPNWIMVQFVCQSVQLALFHTIAETLSRHIEFLV